MIDLDYQVLKYLFRSPSPVKVGELSKKLDIAHSTLGSCVKRLESEGHVVYERYKPVILSESGKDLAIELIRHSQLLEVLLFNELGLSKEMAHDEAAKFNLLFDCNTINKICEKYNHPEKCPCGENILDSPECFCNDSTDHKH